MADTIPLRKDLVQGALKNVIEGTNVPLTHLLKVLRMLQRREQAHKSDREAFHAVMRSMAKKHVENQTTFDSQRGEDTKQRAKLEETITHLSTLKRGEPGLPGDPGKPGNHGDSVDINDVVAEVLRQIDTGAIVSEVHRRIKIPKVSNGNPGKDAVFDKEKIFTEFLMLIKKNRLLDAADVKGLQGFVKDGTKYRFEELMNGSGFSSGSILLPLSGQINNSNVAFVFRRKPGLVNVNGTFYREGKGWSWTASTQTVTLDNPVGANGDIYAI